MGELQATRQQGLNAYFTGAKLVTGMRRPSMYSSEDIVASLDTTARFDASGSDNAVQIEQIVRRMLDNWHTVA